MASIAQVCKQIQQQQTPILDLTTGVVVLDSSGTASGCFTHDPFERSLPEYYSIQKIQALCNGQFVMQGKRYGDNSLRVSISDAQGKFIRRWEPALLTGETNATIHDVVVLPDGRIAVRGGYQKNSVDHHCCWMLDSGGAFVNRLLLDLPRVAGESKKEIAQMFPLADGQLVVQGHSSTPSGCHFWVAVLDSQGSLIRQWCLDPPYKIGGMIPFNGGVAIQVIRKNSCWVYFRDNQLRCLRNPHVGLLDNSTVVAWDVTKSGKCLFLVQTQHQTTTDVSPQKTTANVRSKRASVVAEALTPSITTISKKYYIYCEKDDGVFLTLLMKEEGDKDTDVTFPQFNSLGDDKFAVSVSCRKQENGEQKYTNKLHIFRRGSSEIALEQTSGSFHKEKEIPSIAPCSQGEYFLLEGKDIKVRPTTKIFRGHTQLVTGVVVLSEGYFASTSVKEKVTKIWDIEKGVCLQSFPNVTGKLIVGSKGQLIVDSEDGYLTICDSPIPKHEARGRDFQPIWDTLSGNQVITHCKLIGLPLQDEGVIGLAQMLRMNRTITHLNLLRTGVTDIGAKMVLEAIKVHGKVVVLHLSTTIINPRLIQRIKDRTVKQRRKPVTDPTPVAISVTFNIPDQLCCPISGLVMVDPVMATDGHTYEREVIDEQLQTALRSPVDGNQLPSRELYRNIAIKSQIDSLHVQYPTLIHSGQVYFPRFLKDRMRDAASARDGGTVAALVARDSRLLHEPLTMALPESLFSFALNNSGSVDFLESVVNLLGPDGIKRYVAQEGDEGVYFFRQACRLGVDGARCIGEALGWNGADYEDELFKAIREEDLLRVDACLGLGVALDVTDEDGNTPLHAAVIAGSAHLIGKFLSCSASTKAVNAQGLTPQRLAENNGRADLASFITAKKQEVKIKPFLDPLMNQIQAQQRQMEGQRIEIEMQQAENQALVRRLMLVEGRLQHLALQEAEAAQDFS